jgi:hypothetical protein
MPGQGQYSLSDIEAAQEDPLAKYPQMVQTLAKQLKEYKVPLPSGMALANPRSPWNMAIQAASESDPSFDASQYNTRRALRTDFTSGKAADNIRSLNTLIGHLGTLRENADALHNFSSVLTPLNGPVNWVENKTGDARVKNFDLSGNIAASELRKAVGAGVSEAEMSKLEKDLVDHDASPDQFHGSINTAINMAASRIDALNTQYRQGMGGKSLDIPVLYPHAKAILQKLGRGDVAALDGAPAPALPKGNGKSIDQATAQSFYDAAGRDPQKAQKLAEANGWIVPQVK